MIAGAALQKDSQALRDSIRGNVKVSCFTCGAFYYTTAAQIRQGNHPCRCGAGPMLTANLLACSQLEPDRLSEHPDLADAEAAELDRLVVGRLENPQVVVAARVGVAANGAPLHHAPSAALQRVVLALVAAQDDPHARVAVVLFAPRADLRGERRARAPDGVVRRAFGVGRIEINAARRPRTDHNRIGNDPCPVAASDPHPAQSSTERGAVSPQFRVDRMHSMPRARKVRDLN